MEDGKLFNFRTGTCLTLPVKGCLGLSFIRTLADELVTARTT